MKRNCNLELRLVTPSVFYHSSHYNAQSHSMLDMMGESPDEKQQQLTIFYNGRVATCDVTELQARSIITLARREMEDEKSKSSSWGGSEPTSPAVLISSPIHNNNNNNRETRGNGGSTGLSMKRSLQSFLQKRKSRVQAISPYPIINSRT